MSLNPKQTMFVAKYTQIGSETYGNATRSAIAAGYSPKTAHVMGSQLLDNPKIGAAISSKTNSHLAKIDYSAERVLQELAKMAFVDPRKFYRDDGSLKHPTELDDDTAMALAGMEIEEAYEHFGKGQAKPTGQIKKIKIADKGQNLERLGRHHKLFTDKVELSGDEGLISRLNAGRKRASGKADGDRDS